MHDVTPRRPSGLAALAVLCLFTALAPPPATAASFEVRGYTVSGDNPLSAADTEAVLAPYAGTHEGVGRLLEAARALESELRARGHSFHRVLVPPQELAEGVVRLEVVTFRLGAVTVSGATHSSPARVRDSLPPLVEGEAVNARELTRAVQLANQHPSRRVSVAVRESATPDHIDAELRVREVRAWSAFAALSNTGSEQTGRQRLLLGFQHGDLFDRDHTLTATWTTSPGHVAEVRQYGVAYRLPLYGLAATLTLFATRSEADSGRVADVFDVGGRGTFKGVHLRHLLLPLGGYRHHVEAGLEDHLFEDDTRLAGGPAVGRDVRARPLSLGYGGDWEAAWGNAGFGLAYVRNLDSGSHQDALSYAVNGNGAEPRWDLVRGHAHLRRALPGDLSLRMRARAQYAGEALIAGERMAVAGSGAVRGFDERAVTADDGLVGSAELWSGALVEGVRVLGFVDAGYQRSRAPLPGSPSSQWLASAGVGVRIEPAPGVALSLDAARVLNGAGDTASGDYGVHLSLVLRF